MRICNDGTYDYCRWAQSTPAPGAANLQNTSPTEFFQNNMNTVRHAFLSGQRVDTCNQCATMEQHGKISGRQKQLLKIGVRLEQFEKTLASSPWTSVLADSACSQTPQDWQIDLGNYCNSACVFCHPNSSSRLATEWQRLGLIQTLPSANWTDDPAQIEKFVKDLADSPHIQYLHFIGGETVITPAFRTILEALIKTGLHSTATIGFTTNLTVWDNEICDLLCKFANVNLGLSIETFDSVNDYVRWPSSMPTVLKNLTKWQKLADQQQWLIQIRTTPTVLTIDSVLTVYDWAWDRQICVESCNFLDRPDFMRPSVLPPQYRSQVIDRMQSWLDQHCEPGDTVVNIRNPNTTQLQNRQDLASYVTYLRDQPDESHMLPNLVKFLKTLESGRGNSVLTYLPQYEQLFRSAGY